MGTHARRLALAIVLLVGVGTLIDANVRVPSDPPVYARVERAPNGAPAIVNDGTWAVIPFYRHSGCVPVSFNLLDLFDVPGAFACEARVAGFEVWKALPPPPGGAPIQVLTFGLDDMEIWFVEWNELSAALADDVLTVGELETMETLLKGTATLFKETLHPVGGAKQGMLQMVAFGVLEDGRSFRFSSVDTHQTPRATVIEIQ